MSCQSFQSIYIDDQVEDPNEKIVLIEEMYESMPEAAGVLNSLFKEKFFGLVLAGPTIMLANFRAKMYDYDKENNLGSLEISEILKKIIDICYECECEVVHYKGPIVYDNIPDELKNVSVSVYLRDAFNVSVVDKKTATYAISLKDFNPKNILKELTKNKAIDDLELMDVKEVKSLMDYLNKNEKDLNSLQKAIKESDDKNPNNIVNEIIHEMDVNDDLQYYLGTKYDKLVFYDVMCKTQMTKEAFEDAIMIAFNESAADRSIEIDKKIHAKKELISKLGKEKEKSLLEDIDDLIEEKEEVSKRSDKKAQEFLRNINLGIDKKDKKRIIIASSKELSQEIIKQLRSWEWPTESGVSLKDLENIDWVSGKLNYNIDKLDEKPVTEQENKIKNNKKEKVKKEKVKIDPFTKM